MSGSLCHGKKDWHLGEDEGSELPFPFHGSMGKEGLGESQALQVQTMMTLCLVAGSPGPGCIIQLFLLPDVLLLLFAPLMLLPM